MKVCVSCSIEKDISDFEKNRKKCNKCRSKDRMGWHLKNIVRSKELRSQSARRRNLAIKIKVLTHYSNGSLKCRCCSVSELYFLALDHVNGGGTKHRKAVSNIYRKLCKQGFPPGYHVLCFNCNTGRYFNGGVCPHKKPSDESIKARVGKLGSSSMKLTVDGETRSVREWAAIKNVLAHTIYYRLKRGIVPSIAIDPSARLQRGSKSCVAGCQCGRHRIVFARP